MAIVVGGGPAGVAAAVEMSRAGLSVTLCEQGPRLGGALHRQPNDPLRRAPTPAAHEQRWRALSADLAASSVEVLCQHMFFGVEGNGSVLLQDRVGGRILVQHPAALVLATGGVERVAPIPGWHLPGVLSAGGMQVMMKSTGRPPTGQVLVAGSGPLLVALAAQLTALGNAPVAVLERSKVPLSPWLALRLLKAPAYLSEAVNHLLRLRLAGVPWRRGVVVKSIETVENGRLAVAIEDASGRASQLVVDRVALHDGLRSGQGDGSARGGPFTVAAGDCREVLGGVAAIADGVRAGREVIAKLGREIPTGRAPQAILNRERQMQATLSKMFDYGGSDPTRLPDHTIICRCEGRTLGQLRALLAAGDPVSPREIKLNGRFGMGSCQGRFCAEWVGAFVAQQQGGPPRQVSEFIGNRWPTKPVPVSAFVAVCCSPTAPEPKE